MDFASPSFSHFPLKNIGVQRSTDRKLRTPIPKSAQKKNQAATQTAWFFFIPLSQPQQQLHLQYRRHRFGVLDLTAQTALRQLIKGDALHGEKLVLVG